jgi:hypothetical protein
MLRCVRYGKEDVQQIEGILRERCNGSDLARRGSERKKCKCQELSLYLLGPWTLSPFLNSRPGIREELDLEKSVLKFN